MAEYNYGIDGEAEMEKAQVLKCNCNNKTVKDAQIQVNKTVDDSTPLKLGDCKSFEHDELEPPELVDFSPLKIDDKPVVEPRNRKQRTKRQTFYTGRKAFGRYKQRHRQLFYNLSSGPQYHHLSWTHYLPAVADFTYCTLLRYIPEPFVRTEAMEEALRRIDQQNIAILIGLPGSGKTSMASKMMLEICKKKHALPIKIDNAIEFMPSISLMRKSVIFIDDMFGQSVFSHQRMEQWKPLIEKFVNLVEYGNCDLIITCRTSILKEAKKYLPLARYSTTTDIFSDCHIIDLSNEFILSEEEKTEFIRSYRLNKPNKLGKDEQRLLYKYNTYLSFPLICKLIAEKASNTSDLKNLLLDHTVQIIDRIYGTERTEYLTLVFMALGESYQLHKSISVDLSLTEKKLLEKLACLCSIPFEEDLMEQMLDAAQSLSGEFLRYLHRQEAFEFTDTSVQEAVCLSFSKRFPKIVLKSCNEAFIRKFVTTNETKKQDEIPTRLYVRRSQYKLLSERVAAILLSNFDLVNQTLVLGEYGFVKYFFNFLFEENQLESFLDETIKKPLEKSTRTILFYCGDRPFFLSNLLMQFGCLSKNIIFYDKEFRNVLKHFQAQDKHKCIHIIHKFTENKYKIDIDIDAQNLKSKEEDRELVDSGFNSWDVEDMSCSAAFFKPENKTNKVSKKERENTGIIQNEYMTEVKVKNEYYPSLHFIQSQLQKEFGPRRNFVSELDLIKETIFDEDTWGTSLMYIFSHNLVLKDHLGFFFKKDPGNLQRLTTPVSEQCNVKFADNRPTAKIVILDVMLNSQTEQECFELTLEVIQLIVHLIPKEELAKMIYVINTDSIPEMITIDDAKLIEEITTCIEKVDAFPKNIKIGQYNCFLMDEFQLPNRISECLEIELGNIITRLSDKASKKNLPNDAVKFEKCFEASRHQQKDNISLLATIILSRYQAINSYFLKDGTIHVCVDKGDDVDEKYLKKETGYGIKIDTKTNTGKLVQHIRQGNKICNYERNTYGTLGCFGTLGTDILVGYTCEHVVRDADTVYTEDRKPLGITKEIMSVKEDERVVDALIDIAAFEIDQGRQHECEKGFLCQKRNAIPMNLFQGRDFSEIYGKILYKWGATTNLRQCLFEREQKRRVRPVSNSRIRNYFRREYIVCPDSDQPFGEPGDSGALVCYHNLKDNYILGIFFYIGLNGEGTNEYVCCLAAEALDALHTKGKEEHELGNYRSFALVNRTAPSNRT